MRLLTLARKRFSLTAGVVCLLLFLSAQAAAQESLREASQQARRIKEASTRKVWTNDDMDELRKRSILNVVGQEAAGAAPAVLGEPSAPPAEGKYLSLSMEERQEQLTVKEQAVQDSQVVLAELRDQLLNAPDTVEFNRISERIREVERLVSEWQQEIEDIRHTPPPPAGQAPRPAAPAPAPAPPTSQ